MLPFQKIQFHGIDLSIKKLHVIFRIFIFFEILDFFSPRKQLNFLAHKWDSKSSRKYFLPQYKQILFPTVQVQRFFVYLLFGSELHILSTCTAFVTEFLFSELHNSF